MSYPTRDPREQREIGGKVNAACALKKHLAASDVLAEGA